MYLKSMRKGYSDFDCFEKLEESQFKILTDLVNYVFPFLGHFWRVSVKVTKKLKIMERKNVYNFSLDIKIAEFYAEFKTVGKLRFSAMLC